MVVEAVLDTKKEETIENWTKAVRANSIKLLEEIRKDADKMDTKEIKKLIIQLRRLERRIYQKVRRAKNIKPEEKTKLKKLLLELQAIYKKDRQELKASHLSSLKVLAGEEEAISEEIIRETEKEIEDSMNKGQITTDLTDKVARNFKEVLEKLEDGDIIGVSYAWSPGLFGKAARVFEVATGSRISHVGLINVRKGWLGKKIYVIEASDEVVATPIKTFLTQSRGRVAIYRYKKGLSEKERQTIINKARSWCGEWHYFWKKKAVKYDFFLSPGQEELYCSELVDEAYLAAGIRLTNNYYSVAQFEENLKRLLAQGAYQVIHGITFKSPEEALSCIFGENGKAHYRPIKDEFRFRRNVITPQDITINSNTKKVFDNLT